MTRWLFMNESAVIYDLVIKLGVQCRNDMKCEWLFLEGSAKLFKQHKLSFLIMRNMLPENNYINQYIMTE